MHTHTHTHPKRLFKQLLILCVCVCVAYPATAVATKSTLNLTTCASLRVSPTGDAAVVDLHRGNAESPSPRCSPPPVNQKCQVRNLNCLKVLPATPFDINEAAFVSVEVFAI